MRKITLKEVTAISFKNHIEFNQSFGSLNTIKGSNGEGKSSIGEMITWCLGGVDMMGSKLDPTPTDRKTDKTFASVLLEVDEKPVKFGRESVNGKASYYINDIPKSATEFKDLVWSLTTSDSFDFFLCLFNPSYFPTMHWQDQRNMLFSYVSSPLQSEVLKKLPKLQADKLKESFKKVNIDDLEAFHKKNKTNKEKEVIAAKSRVQTLEGQLQGDVGENLEELLGMLAIAEDLNKEVHEHNRKQSDLASEYSRQEQTLRKYFATIEDLKAKHTITKEQASCHVCEQDISEETKKSNLSKINDSYKNAVKYYKELKLKLEAMEQPSAMMDLSEVVNTRHILGQRISAEQNRLKAVATIEEAKKAHEDVQASLNESIFLLDAIKAFRAEEATQQAEKVKALFTGIQLVLEDHLGKPFFTIAMNGKPYVKLSLGEKLRAGLELINVLSEQSEIQCVTFIDNRESLTSDIIWSHQLIEAYAVPNQPLEVKTQ